jgi:MFS-type transporter involved in bile tolerance (Atg22 family)
VTRAPMPLLERLGLHRPELRAWAMYEWATTGMWAVVVVTVFPIYCQAVAAAGVPGPVALRNDQRPILLRPCGNFSSEPVLGSA